MSRPIRWIEVAQHCQLWRFERLAEELRASGCENEFDYREGDVDELYAQFDDIKSKYDFIRVGSEMSEKILSESVQFPSTMLSFRCVDGLTKDLGAWWPRCYLYDTFMQLIAESAIGLDLSGGVFIMGATAEARAVIAALVRIGFVRFMVSDPDEEKGMVFVEKLSRSFFNVQFQFTSKNLVTQLPAVATVAVNTLSLVDHVGLMNELYYFNFLRAGGLWVETNPIPAESALLSEAVSVGALIEPGVSLIARVDALWAKSCLGVNIDFDRYIMALRMAIEDMKIEVHLSVQESDI